MSEITVSMVTQVVKLGTKFYFLSMILLWISGGNNTAEVIFLLDCSTSVTPMCFHDLTQFVKSVVESFTIGPDNIRVGVVPFSDDVYQTFGINRYNMTYQICAAIGKCTSTIRPSISKFYKVIYKELTLTCNITQYLSNIHNAWESIRQY